MRWLALRDAYRQSGDAVMCGIAKSMPCGLYGRWAQRRSGWEWMDIPTDGRRWGAISWRDWRTGLTHPGRIIAARVEIDMARTTNVLPVHCPIHMAGRDTRTRDVETDHSFPAVAAWITASARELMDRYRATAGPIDCLYQYVDSIHVTQDGYDRLIAAGSVHPTEPGKLKHVCTYGDVTYHGPNCWYADGRLVASGMPGIVSLDDHGRSVHTRYERLESVLSRGPDGTVRIHSGPWTPPANTWGQYAAIGQWAMSPRLGG